MTRRQRARERRAYNHWRRWARAAGGYAPDEACSWAELVRYADPLKRDYARVTGPRRMRADSKTAAAYLNAEWMRRHL
jgi:hypothetical protein